MVHRGPGSARGLDSDPAKHWRLRAACRDHADPDLFWPVGTSGPAVRQAERAKAICRTCPVISECLAEAIANGEDEGVWGGTTPEERSPHVCAWCKARYRRTHPSQRICDRCTSRASTRRGVQPCGTPAAYRRHIRGGEEPCQPCRDAYRAYNSVEARRQREARRRERGGVPRCGTDTGYKQHLLGGEEPCQPCRDAAARRNRGYRARQNAAVEQMRRERVQA